MNLAPSGARKARSWRPLGSGWAAAILLLLVGCSERVESSGPIEVPEERLATAAARERGRTIYLRYCALCHGERADGHGVRRNLSSQPVDFNDSAWRRSVTPREVYLAVREGVQGTAMPAWKVLDREETWDVTAYVLSVAEQGP